MQENLQEESSVLNDEKSEYLDKINETLKNIEVGQRLTEVPEFLPEYEPLRGKKVAIVDDFNFDIQKILPECMVATSGEAYAVLRIDQTIAELTDEILSTDPDIVVIDFDLDGYSGVQVIEELRSRGFEGKIVGRSSANKAVEFMKAGAVGFLDKFIHPASEAVIQLGKLI